MAAGPSSLTGVELMLARGYRFPNSSGYAVLCQLLVSRNSFKFVWHCISLLNSETPPPYVKPKLILLDIFLSVRDLFLTLGCPHRLLRVSLARTLALFFMY